jgi:hypothetical protein
MSDTTSRSAVDIREPLDVDEFYRRYVNRRPVVMKGALADMPAASKWSVEYLASLAPDLPVRLKTGNLARGRTVVNTMGKYAAFVDDLVEGRTTTEGPPPYLHDLPLFSMIPQLRADAEPFPAQMFPSFFRTPWWAFPQFFVGPPGSVTPLHFDTLQTHNLFFQLHGSKRFLMVAAEDRKYCYTYNWRWSHVDAENPAYDRHPLYRHARVSECVVDAGDLLYMPPGTLHHVRSITASISFNVDWHDRYSAARGLTAAFRGMPATNLRYNALFALGVYLRLPLRVLMPGLRSYFTYIS